MVVVSLLLSAQLAPSVALACEGGGEEESGGGGSVSIAPSKYNYGSVSTGGKVTETFTVSTTFSSAEIAWLGAFVELKSIKNEGFIVSSNGCKEVTITSTSPCKIKVTFEPKNKVSYESILEVPWRYSGGLAKGKVTSKLEGLGI